MTCFEDRVRQAKHLVQYEHTYRYLNEHGIRRVSQQTLDLLACIACRQSQGMEATAVEIGKIGCVSEKDTNRTGKKLAERGILYRDRVYRIVDGNRVKPRYDHQIVMVTDEMRRELIANQPCTREVERPDIDIHCKPT